MNGHPLLGSPARTLGRLWRALSARNLCFWPVAAPAAPPRGTDVGIGGQQSGADTRVRSAWRGSGILRFCKTGAVVGLNGHQFL